MSEKKELNQVELEKVSGGGYRNTNGDIGKYENEYNIFVGKYDGVIGTKYLFRKTNSDCWLFGPLLDTYEDGHKYTIRTHKVYVEDGYGVGSPSHNPYAIAITYDGDTTINGDDYKMYRKA